MNKLQVLRIVNSFLFISFLLQVATSLFIFFRIRTSFSRTIFEIHEYNGLTMITLALIHLYLNWGWIRTNILKKR